MDAKPFIRDAVRRTVGHKINSVEFERVVEEVDILLDPTLPNGIYAAIQYEVLGYEVNRLTEVRKKIKEGFL